MVREGRSGRALGKKSLHRSKGKRVRPTLRLTTIILKKKAGILVVGGGGVGGKLISKKGFTESRDLTRRLRQGDELSGGHSPATERVNTQYQDLGGTRI